MTERSPHRFFWNHTEACRAAWRAAQSRRDREALTRLASCTGECEDVSLGQLAALVAALHEVCQLHNLAIVDLETALRRLAILTREEDPR